MNYHFSFDIFYLSSIPSLNGKEGGTLAGWRGPGYGQLRQIINLDAETTSGPLLYYNMRCGGKTTD